MKGMYLEQHNTMRYDAKYIETSKVEHRNDTSSSKDVIEIENSTEEINLSLVFRFHISYQIKIQHQIQPRPTKEHLDTISAHGF